MAQYTTSQEAMQQGATKVDDAATQIQGHISSLRGEVETMMGGWRGEAASTFGWGRWVGGRGTAIGIDHFGASAPAETLFKEFGLTPERVAAAIRALA